MFKRLVKKALRKLRSYASIVAAGDYYRCPTCSNISCTGKYCYKDGSRLVKLPRCTCGHPLTKYDVFCQECGIEIKKEATPSCQS
jgi:hypothetical protein